MRLLTLTKTKTVVLVGVLIVSLLLSAVWPMQLLALYVFVVGLCALRMLWMVTEMKKSFVHLHEIAAQMVETHLKAAHRYDQQESHMHVELVQAIAADIRDLGQRASTGRGKRNVASHEVAAEAPGREQAPGEQTRTVSGEGVIAEIVKDAE
jgi:hypothetical protein